MACDAKECDVCRVQGMALLSGTTFFEVCAASLGHLCEVDTVSSLQLVANLAIAAPKVLDAKPLANFLSVIVQLTTGATSVITPEASTPHVTATGGLVATNARAPALPVPPSALAACFGHTAWRRNTGCSTACMDAVHDGSAVGAAAFRAHPAQADAALHLGAVRNRAGDATMIPVAVGALLSR